MLELFKWMVISGAVLIITFLVLIALPQSKLRDALKPWVIGLLCLAYVVSPVDVLPEVAFGPLGLVDDAGAIVAAITAVRSALRRRQEARDDWAA